MRSFLIVPVLLMIGCVPVSVGNPPIFNEMTHTHYTESKSPVEQDASAE